MANGWPGFVPRQIKALPLPGSWLITATGQIKAGELGPGDID